MDAPMEFELTMRLLFGDRAYHIASSHTHPAHRREWLQKAVRKLLRIVNAIETTTPHKERLIGELDKVSAHLKGAKEPSWELVYALFRLAMRLLGLDYFRGVRCRTPFYYQTPAQYDTAVTLSGGDVMQLYYDQKNAVSIRRSIAKDLRKNGMDDFHISLVLNTTEYKVKQLRSNAAPNSTHRKRHAE